MTAFIIPTVCALGYPDWHSTWTFPFLNSAPFYPLTRFLAPSSPHSILPLGLGHQLAAQKQNS